MKSYLDKLSSENKDFNSLKVPSVATLLKILKAKFAMRYGKSQAANVKYRDPTFNERRLWVSKLLAQFLMEDAVIISVDECNFRSDSLPNKQWGFN